MASNLRFARQWIAWPVATVVGALLLFFVAMLAIGGVVSIFSDDVERTMGDPLAFAVAFTLMFGAAGAGIGLAQWLVAGRQMRPLGWIGGWAAGFAAAGLLFGLAEWAFGDEATWSSGTRAANEVVHNIAGGLVAGFLTWRAALASRGASARLWIGCVALGLLLAGFTVWGVTSAMAIDSADGMPIGFLVMGLVTAWGWGRATATATAAPPRAASAA